MYRVKLFLGYNGNLRHRGELVAVCESYERALHEAGRMASHLPPDWFVSQTKIEPLPSVPAYDMAVGG